MVNTVAIPCAITGLLFLVSFTCGNYLLDRARVRFLSSTEKLLYSSALGFGFFGLGVMLFGTAGILSEISVLLLVSASGALSVARSEYWAELAIVIKKLIVLLRSSPWRVLVFIGIASFLGLSLLCTMAPLTGSDAMHYHFTVPSIWLKESAIVPVPSIANSYFTGFGHMLITLGIAAWNEQLAMGIIYLGGVLSALSTFIMAKRLMPSGWAALAVLIFVAAPMIFWQISISGSPDIWAVCYTSAALLLLTARQGDLKHTILAGVFAGLAASTKYSAAAIPAALAIAVAANTRRLRPAALFISIAFVFGSYQMIRNYVWTGDPVFPLLAGWSNSTIYNTYTWQSVIADVRAADFSLDWFRLISYPVLMITRGGDFGVGHLFGPIILSFAPLILLCRKDVNVFFRSALIALTVFVVVNALTSQMARFLLPVFPIAVALAVFTVSQVHAYGWRLVGAACYVTLTLFLLFCVGVNVLYAKDFLAVVLGREGTQSFLARMAPDYQVADYVNRTLRHQPGKTILFFRHLFYLTKPFVNGDPRTSWLVNPFMQWEGGTSTDLLKGMGITFVVKSPDYPAPLKPVFDKLEHTGILRTYDESRVFNFVGNRVAGVKGEVVVTILQVVPDPLPAQ